MADVMIFQHDLPIANEDEGVRSRTERKGMMVLMWLKKLWQGRSHPYNQDASLPIRNLIPGVYYRIALEPEHCITFVGEGIFDLLGYTAKELMNRNMMKYLRATHPEFEEILAQKRFLCRQGRDAKKLQYFLFTKSRASKQVDDHFIGEYDKKGNLIAINGYFREARTSVVKLQLLNQLEAYRAAIDVNIISSITDSLGTIIYANDNFKKVSQYNDEELLGKNHRIVRSGHHPKSFFEKMWKTISSGNMWRGEILNRAKDGSLYWVDTVIIPVFDEHGKINTYLSLRLLVTERKRSEEQREKYIHTLENIAHVVAHDLRGPVCSILGLAQLMKKGAFKEHDIKHALSYLVHASQKLDAITRDLSARIYAADQEVKESKISEKTIDHTTPDP
jgi:PAS domain S-box-containing protein